MMSRSPSESLPEAFVFMAALTALMLFDLGWFREQFCIIACPYGRFQSVLLDTRLTSSFLRRIKRGEPSERLRGARRSRGRLRELLPLHSGLPDRNRHPARRPTEVVACAACMDVSDDVMSRLHEPKGLIRYDTLIPGKAPKALRFRP